MKIPLSGLLAFLLLAPFAGAILTPDVTFIPDKISANSSFIVTINPHATPTEIVGVTMIVPGVESGVRGIPYNTEINEYLCYFSNTDPQQNCGPSIFKYSSAEWGIPYEVRITAFNQYEQTENTTLNLTVGGITITSRIDVIGQNVYILAQAKGNPNSISYKVYNTADISNFVKSGTIIYNPQLFGYPANITLTNGEYYIAFSASSSTDFGGGVSRVTVGQGIPSEGKISLESCTVNSCQAVNKIVYATTINSGQTFTLKKFKLTNTGTENITAINFVLSTDPVDVNNYISISAESTSLKPNESTFLIITLKNIQDDMNISTTVTMSSNIVQQFQIPMEFSISVIGGDYTTCTGKPDKAECLGGICCAEVCRKNGANCCSVSDCGYAEKCSSSFKCEASVIPGECEGKADMTACTGGRCCSGSCIAGGECCSDPDCTSGTCSYNSCQQQSECSGKADGDSCTSGVCCSESCVDCCTNEDCDTTAGETCSTLYICETNKTSSEGIDFVTIAIIIGGVAAAAVVGFFVFKKFKKKGGGDEELDAPAEEGEDEFSDEDFY